MSCFLIEREKLIEKIYKRIIHNYINCARCENRIDLGRNSSVISCQSLFYPILHKKKRHAKLKLVRTRSDFHVVIFILYTHIDSLLILTTRYHCCGYTKSWKEMRKKSFDALVIWRESSDDGHYFYFSTIIKFNANEKYTWYINVPCAREREKLSKSLETTIGRSNKYKNIW